MTIQEILDGYNNRINILLNYKSGVKQVQSIVENLGLAISTCGEYLDFDYLSHEDVIRVMLAFGGKWTKELVDGEAKINYTRDVAYNGIIIRCFYGAPPPNCKIVEEEVEIPETVTPARKALKRSLVCKE